AVLFDVAAKGGMHPEARVGKLLEIAETARRLGDWRGLARRPPAEAARALRRFPGIGEPGAEKILLFAGALEVLALESNGLRVLLRLGYGEEEKSYAAAYKSAQAAAAPQPPGAGVTCLARPHLPLRRHAQA